MKDQNKSACIRKISVPFYGTKNRSQDQTGSGAAMRQEGCAPGSRSVLHDPRRTPTALAWQTFSYPDCTVGVGLAGALAALSTHQLLL